MEKATKGKPARFSFGIFSTMGITVPFPCLDNEKRTSDVLFFDSKRKLVKFIDFSSITHVSFIPSLPPRSTGIAHMSGM